MKINDRISGVIFLCLFFLADTDQDKNKAKNAGVGGEIRGKKGSMCNFQVKSIKTA